MPEETISHLDLGEDLSDVPEMHSVPKGEYQLQLLEAGVQNQKPEKGTGRFIIARFDVATDPSAKTITHVMMLPDGNQKEKTNNLRKLGIKEFYETFNIPLTGEVDFEDYVGNVGWALLKEEETEEYGMQNRINRFIPKK